MEPREFINQLGITDQKIESVGLSWANLLDVHNDYQAIKSKIHPILNKVAETLSLCDAVHSIRKRIKDPNHLVEKIIRRREEKPDEVIDKENYQSKIKDLLGVRVIHVFKSNWLPIHEYILRNWDPTEKDAYIRDGDSEDLTNIYEEHGLNVTIRTGGYRSIHYTVHEKYMNKDFPIEIQVRTIFEEGWAEVDHTLRYPYKKDDVFCSINLLVLNRISGLADETTDMIQFNILERDLERKKYEEEISDLKKQLIEIVKSSHVEVENKKRLEDQINKVFMLEQIEKILQNQTETQKYFERLNPFKKCKCCGEQYISSFGFPKDELCSKCYIIKSLRG